MMHKFDTFSEMLPVFCMDCPALYSKRQQFQDIGVGFLA